MLKTVPSRGLILRLFGVSLVVARSVGRTYRMGGRLLSCSFSHSESFSPLGLLRVVLIFGVLPESGTKLKSFECRSQWNL
jgi:hypothetical protein